MAENADSTSMPERERAIDYGRIRSIMQHLEGEATDARILAVISTQVIEHTFRTKLPAGPRSLDVFQVTDEEVEVMRFCAYRAEAATKMVQSAVDDLTAYVARRAGA